ncbi:MAG: hypothetical protein ACM3PP_10625, partial [Candidatus Saccharibacteria bacterium]
MMLTLWFTLYRVRYPNTHTLHSFKTYLIISIGIVVAIAKGKVKLWSIDQSSCCNQSSQANDGSEDQGIRKSVIEAYLCTLTERIFEITLRFTFVI